jgi:catechol 2,3-dioxygenase-like lactoylglutathione lyase family enzyme
VNKNFLIFFKILFRDKFNKEDMGAKATFLKLGGFYLELWQFKDMKKNLDDFGDIKIREIRHLAFEVNDLGEVIERLTEKGLKFSEPQLGASGHNYSFAVDPNGVALEFYEK